MIEQDNTFRNRRVFDEECCQSEDLMSEGSFFARALVKTRVIFTKSIKPVLQGLFTLLPYRRHNRIDHETIIQLWIGLSSERLCLSETFGDFLTPASPQLKAFTLLIETM